MSAAERLDAWIEEIATVREMLAALPFAAGVLPVVAAREQALREAAAIFAAEAEELAEEVEEEPQEGWEDPADPAEQADQVADEAEQDPAPAEASPPSGGVACGPEHTGAGIGAAFGEAARPNMDAGARRAGAAHVGRRREA